MRRYGLMVVVLLAVAGWTWASESPALSAGIALVANGEYAQALQTLAPLGAENPEDTVIQYWLGRALYGEGLYRLAAKSLTISAARDGRNRDICLWHARALRAAGQTKEAVTAFASYQARFPDDKTFLAEYASARALAGDYAGARESFNQLLARDASAVTRARVQQWLAALNGLASRNQLEPALYIKKTDYELRYDFNDMAVTMTVNEVDRARKEIGEALGTPITGFRVLLFSTWAGYARYARIFLPEQQEPSATAFTLPNLLVLWSPDDWPTRRSNSDEFASTIRHEMAHLAIAARTDGQGVPLWLNEGLACHFGGSGGVQTGQLAATPLPLRTLDQYFQGSDLNNREQAYAQAYAMATVMVDKLGKEKLLTFLDLLADGAPVPAAYTELTHESWATLLAEWPARYRMAKASK